MMWLKTGTIPNQEKKQNNEEEGKGGRPAAREEG